MTDTLSFLTDSKHSTLNLAQGAPRSAIEARTKAGFRRRGHLDTVISRVKAHTGIQGNGISERRAAFESALGAISNAPHIATEGGCRVIVKARGSWYRRQPGYLELASSFSVHLAKDEQRPTAELAPSYRQGRLTGLPMRPPHPRRPLITLDC